MGCGPVLEEDLQGHGYLMEVVIDKRVSHVPVRSLGWFRELLPNALGVGASSPMILPDMILPLRLADAMDTFRGDGELAKSWGMAQL